MYLNNGKISKKRNTNNELREILVYLCSCISKIGLLIVLLTDTVINEIILGVEEEEYQTTAST